MRANNYIKIGKNKVQASLEVFFFEEDGLTYALAPSLNLLGCGHTIEEAKESFEIVFEDYLEFGISRKTLEVDLREHGWEKLSPVQYSTPDAWVIISKNPQLQEIVAGNYTKESIPISVPC